MNISLTPELERYIQRKVKSGRYHSASEVVREGLRLLEEQDKIRAVKLEALRHEIQIGIDQADRGETEPFTPQTLRQIQKEGRAALAASRKHKPR